MNEYLRPFAGFDGKLPLYITLSGVTYPNPAYHIIRSVADVAVIEYVTAGEGYVVTEGVAHRVRPDTVYFLPMGEHHEYYADSRNPFTKIFMNVKGSLCDHLIMAYSLSGKHFFDGSGLRPLFDRVVAAIRSDMLDVELQSLLQGIFVEIISRLSVVLNETKYSDEALKLKSYLDSTPDRLVSAAELSGVIFRSQDYCRKLFSHEFGVTPYAYQLERKMQTARLLLIDTHMSIGEIAERLGYTDLHYFSNLFYRKCGCRPSEYRKRKVENNNSTETEQMCKNA